MKIKNGAILVTGGGTGGHLMPAIAICEELYKKGFTPILVTDKRCEKYIPNNLAVSFKIIDVVRVSGIKRIFHSIYSWIKAIYDSVDLIRKEEACAIIGCGGYSSLPLILSGFFLRRKIILHEQNAYVGRTNYILSYIADLVFLSFMHTVNLPLIDRKKIIWSGIPLTQNHITQLARPKSKKDSETITILVTGGSQGALIFDELILKTLTIIRQKLPEYNIKIIQQVRGSVCEKLKNEYEKMNIESDIANFFYNMANYYSEADLYVGRSGASSVNEIIHYQIPAILIPYPFAQNNHQYYNAKNLVEFKAAFLIEQKNISPEILSEKIIEVIKNKQIISGFMKQLSDMRMDSAEIIIQEIRKF